MRIRRPRSFFWSLTVSILGILVLTAVLQFLFVLFFVEPVARSRQRGQAEEVLAAAAGDVATAVASGSPPELGRVLSRYERLAPGMFLAFDPDDGPRVLARRGRGPGARLRRTGPPPALADARVVARAEVRIDGERAGELLVLHPRRSLAFSRTLPDRWLLLIPGAIVATLLGGMWIFRRLERRLRRLEAQARAVGEGDLSARIEDPGDDELGRVGHQLNAMAAHLEDARAEVESMESERRRLLADITHEISTPLTSIRGYAETLRDQRVEVDDARRRRYLDDILHASERMALLVDDLLDLTRLEAGASELDLERIDLDSLLRHSVERHRPRLREAGVAVECVGAASPRWVEADGRRLEQVVDNLLTNAARHVPRGGQVELEVREEADVVVLQARDDGPGFPPTALGHVFERFYRGEASRSSAGSGLGLAIVREIVLRHGGSIEAGNLPAGGARITVRLPRPA